MALAERRAWSNVDDATLTSPSTTDLGGPRDPRMGERIGEPSRCRSRQQGTRQNSLARHTPLSRLLEIWFGWLRETPGFLETPGRSKIFQFSQPLSDNSLCH